jgi:hypothetical protein
MPDDFIFPLYESSVNDEQGYFDKTNPPFNRQFDPIKPYDQFQPFLLRDQCS